MHGENLKLGVMYLKSLINLYPHLPLFNDGFSFRWATENISAMCTATTASLRINGAIPTVRWPSWRAHSKLHIIIPR